MNEHDAFEETLARFRDTLPPAGVCDANRDAMRAALESRNTMRWWRRSISLPLPVALTAAAALLVSLTFHMLAAARNARPPQLGPAVGVSAKHNQPGTSLIAAAKPQVEYFETQRYVSGVGVIDRDVLYRFQE